MDRITRRLLDEFRDTQELGQLDESAQFERLAIFCIGSKEYGDDFDVESLCVGGGQDLGLDGIAILVNGSLVTNPEEVDDLLATNSYIEARFIFVQAKTAASFSSSEIGSFAFGVKEFFSENLRFVANEGVTEFREVEARIYEHSPHFRRGKPICSLYYVTTGKWQDDPNLAGRIDAGREDLEETGLFSNVIFQPVDADLLYRLYQDTKNVVSVEFQFNNRTSLPEIEGVKEAYLGILPVKEYLRLVIDDAGNIRKSLFYDNVRDFQSYNPVNRDIQKTLRDQTAQGRFAVLNNGITIVAKSLRPTGNRFLLEDYQIVNGCQTSHVLYDERDSLGDNVYVPIRVISTSDDNITNAIITATNRQTEVKQEDLQALSSFQRKLEAYYESFQDRQRLFYERRSKQYASVAGIEKARIVTMPQEIRAFSSMFLDEPHRASRYYATLLKLIGARIFAENHQLEPYYASAFASYKLEYLFRNQAIPTIQSLGLTCLP